MDRTMIVEQLLSEAVAEVEATHYPEGVSRGALEIAHRRLAMVPTPLLVSGQQNVVGIVLHACAEMELELAGIVDQRVDPVFDQIINRTNARTRWDRDFVMIGDAFRDAENNYAVISDIVGDRCVVTFSNDKKAVEVNLSLMVAESMLREWIRL